MTRWRGHKTCASMELLHFCRTGCVRLEEIFFYFLWMWLSSFPSSAKSHECRNIIFANSFIILTSRTICAIIYKGICSCRITRKVRCTMGINYKRLWKLLIDKDMTKTELRKQTEIASSTLSKMSRNEYVSLEVLVRICCVLNCELSDIAEIEK
nr:MAG TPA: Cro/C1-type HTH DNA-binding domain protein [Caudoviricetes sp.]